MPIEFYCSSCSKLLRTPDASAGKKAKCPQCGAIVDVPPAAEESQLAAATADPFAAGTQAPTAHSQVDPYNPYAAPTTFSSPFSEPATKGTLEHRRIDFDSVFRKTWSFFVENLGPLALFGVVIFAINAVLQVINQVGSMAAQFTSEPMAIVGFGVVSTVLGIVVQTYVSTGTTLYMLKMARTRDAKLNDFFKAGPYFLRGLGLTIVLALIFSAAALICMLPGLLTIPLEEEVLTFSLLGVGVVLAIVFVTILWLKYAILSWFFLVDRDASVGEALSASSQFMAGNKGTTFLIMLVTGFLGMLFMCVTCFLGQVLYIPYFGLLTAVIYFGATNQPWFEPLAKP